MATPNFTCINARAYYAVSDRTTYIDDDGKEKACFKDDADYQMDIDNLKGIGKEHGFESVSPDRYNYSRTFEGHPIMEKDENHQWGKNDYLGYFMFTMRVYVVDGYYSGGTYDWDVKIETNYGDEYVLSDYDDEDGMIDDIMDGWMKEAVDYEWQNAGLAKIHVPNVRKFLAKYIDMYSNECDAICEKACDQPLVKTAQFSNGEAIYEPAGTLRAAAKDVDAA